MSALCHVAWEIGGGQLQVVILPVCMQVTGRAMAAQAAEAADPCAATASC
jgi:hypothetical protein